MIHLPKKMAGGLHQQHHMRSQTLREAEAPVEGVEADAAQGKARHCHADGLVHHLPEDVGRGAECGSKNAHTITVRSSV